VPGAKAVFAKFDGYVSRDEKPSWLSGAKKVLVDRVEWVVMPDPATASAALQNGEVDWWENPITDLVPVLQAATGTSRSISPIRWAMSAASA
jgi:peptide/nickel transport system substrate-binding protein